MKARAVVFVVLLAATALAGLAATAVPPRPDPPAVAVPNGSVGDVATYHVASWHAALWPHGPENGAFEERFAMQVAGVEDIPDQHGDVRRVVRAYLAGGQLADGTTHQRTEHVDAATRDIVRVDTERQEVGGDVGTLTWFGPRFTSLPLGGNPSFRFALSNQTYLRFQDREFTLGEDLGAERGAGLAADVADFGTPRAVVVASSRVDRQGSHDGQAVLGVTDRWDVREPELGLRETGEQVTWVAAGSPYPVLVERSWRKEWPGGWETSNKTYTRLSWEPGGGGPIPWGASPAAAAFPVQWSKGPQWLPDEGTGSRLPFRVDQASAKVVADPALDGFAAWRRSNPGWQLVGFDLRAGAVLAFNDLPGYLVELTYAAPGGETAYRVRSTYADAALPPVNDNGRAFALRSASADFRLSGPGPETPPVTWSHIDALWRAIGQPERTAKSPDRLVWGYAQVGECPEDGAVVACSWSTREDLMSYVRWGRDRGLYAAPPGADPRGVEVDVIELAIHDNRLIHAHRGDGLGAFDPLLADREPVPVLEVSRVDPPPILPLGNAGLWAAAALALAALLLWADAVKAWLAKAVAVAGFSRLDEPEVLGHPTRGAILRVVGGHPGSNATEVAAALPAAGWSTVVYHLAVLVRHGSLEVVADGRHRRYFPGGTGAQARQRQAVLRNPRTKSIHDLLAQGPGMTRQQLADRVGISVQGVAWHLDRLRRAGLLEAGGGRPATFRANHAGPSR